MEHIRSTGCRIRAFGQQQIPRRIKRDMTFVTEDRVCARSGCDRIRTSTANDDVVAAANRNRFRRATVSARDSNLGDLVVDNRDCCFTGDSPVGCRSAGDRVGSLAADHDGICTGVGQQVARPVSSAGCGNAAEQERGCVERKRSGIPKQNQEILIRIGRRVRNRIAAATTFNERHAFDRTC